MNFTTHSILFPGTVLIFYAFFKKYKITINCHSSLIILIPIIVLISSSSSHSSDGGGGVIIIINLSCVFI